MCCFSTMAMLLRHLATARDEPQMCGALLGEEGRKEQPEPGRAAGDAVAAILQASGRDGVGK